MLTVSPTSHEGGTMPCTTSCVIKEGDTTQGTQSHISEDRDRIACTMCGIKFKVRGLKIHARRCHGTRDQNQQNNATTTDNLTENRQPAPPIEDLGEKLAGLKATIPTLRRVPKGARLAVAQTLSSVINEVVTKNDVSSWENLLTFPYAALEVPQKCDNVKNLTKWVKNKVERWTHGPFEPQARTRTENFNKRKDGSEFDMTNKIEAKLADGDIRGAIRLATTDDTIAPASAKTLQALQAKHPGHDPPLSLPCKTNTSACPPVSEKDVHEAISSFPPGSAGGLDGLRPQILKDLTSKPLGQAATQLKASIQQLADLLLSGTVPDAIAPILFGASLTALQKKDGGIRPVAVGTVWRRLVSKIVVARITPTVTELVSPNQLGVGVKGGAEGGAHTARRYWNHTHSSPKVFLKLDFRNAFNELRRDSMLHAVQSHFPAYFNYIYSCYAHPSLLFYGKDSISSQRGIQQGDPLGPTLFSITVQPIVDAIQTELNVWYLDDGTMADSIQAVLRDLDIVRGMSEEVGLQLNERKCEVYILGNTSEAEREDILSRIREAAPNIPVTCEEEATLLGAPLTDAAIKTVLDSKTTALVNMSKRLEALSSQAAFFLLRASVSIPRLIYFLRCAPAWKCLPSIFRYDWTLKCTLETILNCSLNEESLKQSSLPVKNGGLGIRHAADVAIPCFLASSHAAQHLVARLLPPEMQGDPAEEEGMSIWRSRYHQDLPSPNERHKQHVWEEPHILSTVRSLYEAAPTTQDKARLLAIQQPDAGSWLSVIPSPQLGTNLANEAFRVCCALRLGCDICQPHKCPCGEVVNTKGHHGLSCKQSSGRRSRHERVNDIVSRALRSAEVPNIREPAGCSRADGKRPDGLTLVPWSQGRSLVWDFTCADTVAPSYLCNTETVPGAAADKAERRKQAKYNFLSDRFSFVPMAIETFGVWGTQCRGFIAELSSRLQDVTGDKRVSSFLKQRLSLAVQSGNVASILGTLPYGKALDEIFFLN